MALDVLRVGSGPPVVLVHGSIVGGERAWRHQLPLAERWSLVIPSRPGFGASPPIERGDFDAEAPLIADLLGAGAHLVGHSYGAVIALLAAALRPEAVLSLTVSEPGALGVAEGHPAVDRTRSDGERLYAARLDPREFVLMFRSGVNSTRETPDDWPDWLERGARHARDERPPWEADVPLDRLAAAPFPALVMSGAHSEAFEVVCDTIADAIGAERAVIPGRGHTIPATGAPYNERLERFLRSAAAGSA